MSSTEEDTFNRLKSITFEQAKVIHNDEHSKLVKDLGLQDEIGFISIPYDLLSARMDERFKPYGWTFKRFMNERAREHYGFD